MTDRSVLWQLILILILTMLNGFFAASEIAIVSLDKNRLRKKSLGGDAKAQLLLELLEKPSKFLSTIQVGITFAGFFSSASAAVGISDKLGSSLSEIGVPFAKDISFVGVTLILSYFVLVFGELVPKRVALQAEEKFSRFAIKPIVFISKVMKPFVKLLSYSTNAIIRLLGYETEGVEEEITLEEIKSIIEVGEEQGVIETTEKDMINSIMSFDDKIAEEIMTARTNVFMIDIDKKIEKYIDMILKLKYSRIPVYRNMKDNIIGILYLKDLIPELNKNEIKEINLEDIIRQAFFVPERIKINELFVRMQRNKTHIAVLIDQYGGFTGIVSMEDLLEEIVGEIDDEYDTESSYIRILDDNNFEATGLASIKELNRVLQTEIDETSDEYDTLGGYLIYKLNRIPKEEEKNLLIIDNIKFEIEEIKNKKIEKVKITKKYLKGNEDEKANKV